MKLVRMFTNSFDPNLNKLDRIIRALLALSIPVLYFTGLISGVATIILGVVALLTLRTSLTAKCGIYYGLGISSLRKADEFKPLK